MNLGLYGKLPSHGDFLRRRVSDAFVDTWEGWLQGCLTESRTALGDRWLDLYLTSPAWRFLAAPGACGPTAVIGLMVPSVDRVGRYFPLTLVAELPPPFNPVGATRISAPFFAQAERLIDETFETEVIDFAAFEERVVALGELLEPLTLPPRVALGPDAAEMLTNADQLWQLPIGSANELGPAFEQLLSKGLTAAYDPLVLWWTDGSSVVDPCCLVTQGLPPPRSFVGLLDGEWAQARWQTVSGAVDTNATVEFAVDAAEVVQPIAFRSAARSDIGLVREVNEDAFIERSEVGIWVVADGLGGHREGEIASRMVCDALADLVPDATFEGTVYEARQRLQRVNEYLLRTAPHGVMTDRKASTVVVLMARGSSCAVLWAGDSRLYRCRSGSLECLTVDHAVAEHAGGGRAAQSNAITRAVGVQPTLALDLVRERVCAGDRYLLCSDGLTRNLSEPEIAKWLRHDNLDEAILGLIGDTLAAGAPDNVTVLIAEAYTPPV